MIKRYMMRENEVLYYSEKEGFIEIPKTHINFKKIMDYLLKEDFEEAVFLEMVKDNSVNIEKITKGKIKEAENGQLMFEEKIKVPKELAEKIEEFKRLGFDQSGLEKFWKKCLQNPEPKSIEMLFRFLENANLTICPDGDFLAYKGVNEDFTDCHTGSIDNSPGKEVTMPREEVVFDPNSACHRGLHVGSFDYASTFGRKTLLVRVNPKDVVSVPYDLNSQKMRVCRYVVEKVYVSGKSLSTGQTNKKMEVKTKPSPRKGSWSEEEISILKKLCKSKNRPSWKEVGERLMRSSEACRKKWETIR